MTWLSPIQCPFLIPLNCVLLGPGFTVTFCPSFNTGTNTVPQYLVGPWCMWNKWVTRTNVSRKCFCMILVYVLFPFLPLLNYCWIFSLYQRVLHFFHRMFYEGVLCQFKWVAFLSAEPMPCLVCIILSCSCSSFQTYTSTPSSLPSCGRHWASVEQAVSRNCTKEYLIRFSTPKLTGITLLNKRFFQKPIFTNH